MARGVRKWWRWLIWRLGLKKIPKKIEEPAPWHKRKIPPHQICLAKMRFRKKIEAWEWAANYWRVKDIEHDVYHCCHCNGFHLTTILKK